MALRFVDSFDNRSTAQVASRYYTSSGTPAIEAGAGRYGSQGLHVTDDYLVKSFDDTKTWILGFAIKLVSGSVSNFICLNYDSRTQSYIRIETDGHLSLYYNAVPWGGWLATSSIALLVGVWHYVEIKITMDSTDGVCVMRIDEQECMNKTSLNVMNHSYSDPEFCNNMVLFDSVSAYIDDLYIADNSGLYNNDFLGDVRIECLLPVGAGNNTDFTPSAGDNYQTVNDPADPGPNDDTDYNETSTPGNIDTFVFEDLQSLTGSIKAVAVSTYDRKTDGGGHTLKHMVYDGANREGTSTHAVPDSYQTHTTIFEREPGDNGAWEIADVNNNEYGYKMES